MLKRISKENGKECIYVQNKDLFLLKKYLINNTFDNIPPKIIAFLKPLNIFVIDYKYMNEYTTFTDLDEIEFLNKLDWVIDLDEFSNFSIEELKNIINQLEQKKDIYNIYKTSDVRSILKKKEEKIKKKSKIKKIIFKLGKK